jgi:hypothetical protein
MTPDGSRGSWPGSPADLCRWIGEILETEVVPTDELEELGIDSLLYYEIFVELDLLSGHAVDERVLEGVVTVEDLFDLAVSLSGAR